MFSEIEANFCQHLAKTEPHPNEELLIEHIKKDVLMVSYGDTIVIGSLNAVITKPADERPYEGCISFFVSSLQCKDFFGDEAPFIPKISSFLEKTFKTSRCLDLESLLISPASSCWALRLDIHLIQDSGYLLTAASIAALTLLLSTKLPQTSIDDEGSPIIHSFVTKNPKALNMFLKPLSTEIYLKRTTPRQCLYVAFSSTNELIGISQESILDLLLPDELSFYLIVAQKRIASLNNDLSRSLLCQQNANKNIVII